MLKKIVKNFFKTMPAKNTKETEAAILAEKTQTTALALPQRRTPAGETGELLTVETPIFVSENTPLTLADLVDDEDKIVEAVEIPNKINKLWNLAARSSIRHLRQLNADLGGRIYAAICKNEKGEKHIVFAQKYNNDNFSEPVAIPQENLLSAFKQKLSSENAKASKAFQKFIDSVEKEYFKNFDGTTCEMLKVEEIVQLLFCSFSELPVYIADDSIYERQEFLKKIAETVRILPTQMENHHPSYFTISADEIDYVAKEMGMTTTRFLKTLKEYGLLYLSESAKGYQNNVRFKNLDGSSYTRRAYCIFNFDYMAREDEEDDSGIGDDF